MNVCIDRNLPNIDGFFMQMEKLINDVYLTQGLAAGVPEWFRGRAAAVLTELPVNRGSIPRPGSM